MKFLKIQRLISKEKKIFYDDIGEDVEVPYKNGQLEEELKENSLNNVSDQINDIVEDDFSPFMVYEEIIYKRKVPSFYIIEAVYDIDQKKENLGNSILIVALFIIYF